MWNAVFKTVAEAVISLNQRQSSPRTENPGNVNIQGHINHMPVDVSINRGAGNSSANPNYRPPPQNSFGPSTDHFNNNGNTGYTGPVPSKTQKNSSYNRASNNSNNSSTKQNDKKFVVVDKPKTNKPKNNDNTFCMVKMPSNGNFKIHIEKTGPTDSRRMNSNSANKNSNNGNNDNKQKNRNKKFRKQQTSSSNNRQNTWMYVGKLKIGTTESDLSSYLKVKFPKNQFTVQSLPLYKDGKLPCFKVLVDNSILNEFELLGNWPNGVTIKKYQNNFKA
ncbi:unnamed protein product [Ceutorhynchus assimilis]|uniref:Uncharacterized protein n=1 Tax=Ceutorhynchus assimilis TaxID=467358 RepID=A0A9N9MR70_9CUCU|nr:unnamed protein product [Ceutorhynchus assimilis]